MQHPSTNHRVKIPQLPLPIFHHCRVIWKQHDLTFNSLPGNTPTLDLSHKNLEQILWEIYPNLHWLEVSLLLNKVKSLPRLETFLNPNELLKKYNLRDSEHLKTLMIQSQAWPLKMSEWVLAKRASLKDLRPLLSISKSQHSDFKPWLQMFAEKNFSRSEGKQLLNWIVDIFLMNKSITPLLNLDPTAWRKVLFSTRFPNTAQEDRKPSPLSLPNYCSIKTQRHTDHLEQSLSFHFYNYDDALKKIDIIRDKISEFQWIQNQTIENAKPLGCMGESQ